MSTKMIGSYKYSSMKTNVNVNVNANVNVNVNKCKLCVCVRGKNVKKESNFRPPPLPHGLHLRHGNR